MMELKTYLNKRFYGTFADVDECSTQECPLRHRRRSVYEKKYYAHILVRGLSFHSTPYLLFNIV